MKRFARWLFIRYYYPELCSLGMKTRALHGQTLYDRDSSRADKVEKLIKCGEIRGIIDTLKSLDLLID